MTITVDVATRGIVVNLTRRGIEIVTVSRATAGGGGGIISSVDPSSVDGLQLHLAAGTLSLAAAGHLRYALTRTVATLPTLAEMQAATTSMTDVLAVGPHADARYHHFADIYSQVEFIGQEGQRNSRGAFADGVDIGQVSGVTYYRYSSMFPLGPETEAVSWEIRQ